MNLALCEKRAGDPKKVESILASEDWRSSSLEYQSAVAAIRGQTSEAIDAIRRGFAAEQLSKSDLIQWPVFEHLRTLKSFKKVFEELVGQDAAEHVFVDAGHDKPVGTRLGKVLSEARKLISVADKRTSDAEAKRHENTQEPQPAARSNSGSPVKGKRARPVKTPRAKPSTRKLTNGEA